jgi:hypothetical protein
MSNAQGNSRLPAIPNTKPEYLSQHAAARLTGLPDGRRVTRLLTPDAWMVGPVGKRWPLWLRTTIEQWVAEGIRDGRQGGAAR